MPSDKPDEQTTEEFVEPILQFFTNAHLPAHLITVSQPFGALARQIVNTLPRNSERTVALREAKDAAVRAMLFI